jgi:hypothetical protein
MGLPGLCRAGRIYRADREYEPWLPVILKFN